MFAEVLGWERAIEIGFNAWQEGQKSDSQIARSRQGKGHGSTGWIYVPKQIRKSRPPAIIRIAGERDSIKLSAALGGEFFFFPSLKIVFLKNRNSAIVAQSSEGRSPADLGITFGMSERQISRILAKSKAAKS